jgi:hypothetical protein
MFTVYDQLLVNNKNMKNENGPQVFDLPVANLNQYVGHYVPPPARDETEIARRKDNPKGSLILEMQSDGVEILSKTFEIIGDDKDANDYFAREIGGVCLNTAWYSYANLPLNTSRAKLDSVGRRRLEFPKLARFDDEGNIYYETEVNNSDELEDSFMLATGLATKLEKAHKSGNHNKAYVLRKQFGHKIGNTGLRLAATHLITSHGKPYDIQTRVRDAGLTAIHDSRKLHEGTYPTVAQLADNDSQLLVYLRRSSPTPMRDALIEATSLVSDKRKGVNNA